MLAAIVSILSLAMMLLIIVSFVSSAFRERRRLVSAAATQLPPLPATYRGSLALVPRGRSALALNNNLSWPQVPLFLPPSWYRRRRTLISLGFLFMLFLALFVQSSLADGALQKLGASIYLFGNSYSSSEIRTAPQTTVVNASQNLVRISQLDPNQYSSPAEWNTWAYSACSTASMTEAFNAYGYHYRITDVLKVEAQLGEITPALGLLRPEGIANTAAQFGFKTDWGNNWTIDQVITAANNGNPVIVDFPPDRYAGGHLLVVTGGNDTYVFLADSSLWNRHQLTRGQFLQWFGGFAAVVTPR